MYDFEEEGGNCQLHILRLPGGVNFCLAGAVSPMKSSLLATVDCSLLTVYCSPFTDYRLLLTVHHSLTTDSHAH